MASIDTQNSPRRPAFKRADQNDMIPLGLVRAMFGVAAITLALVSYASFTGQPKIAVPAQAPIVAEWPLRLIGGDAQSVVVQDIDGRLLADLPHGGFITVVQNGLATMRRRHGIDPTLPIRIVKFENGRLAALDDYTEFRVELTAFGTDNQAAFERLLATNVPAQN
ncbi:MAG: photosynthetic complex assembly protein PuhC [Lutimaribacter sp.]|jgi:putative photosynthetic complex assembly protein